MHRIRRLIPRFGLKTFLVLLTLLCVYLGGYVACVVPVYEAQVVSGKPSVTTFPVYRLAKENNVDSEVVKIFFAPLHMIDRLARPNVWDPVMREPDAPLLTGVTMPRYNTTSVPPQILVARDARAAERQIRADSAPS